MSTVTTVYKNVQGFRTAIKDVSRARQIVSVLAGHGFGHIIGRLQLSEIIGIRVLLPQRDESDVEPISFPKRFRTACEELGPTFVKLGQILSTRSDLVGPEIANELQGLQDDVPPMKWSDVQHQIEKELHASYSELFESFDEEPLACASVAQVHRACLKDGTDVVVKIRRRGISAGIESDLNILHFMAVQAEQFVPELSLMDPVGVIGEFEKALSKELNFLNEQANIERFRQNFEGYEGIYIPQTFGEFCSAGILTMEFIEGVKVTHAVEKVGADPYIMAPRMIKALFKMVFEDGFFHGDLHPGNILITKDHTIALIDFGLVGRLLPRQREDILDLLVGISKEDYEIIARVFFDLGNKVPGVDYDYNAFENDVVELLEQHVAGKILADIDVQAFFGDLVNGAIKHQIKMPPTYTMVFKALMTVEGIGKTLAPEVNFIEESKPFIKEMMIDRYSPERLLRETVDTLSNTGRFVRRFAQTAPRLLRDMEQGRLALRLENRRLDEMVVEQKRTSIRQMRAVLFGACILTSAVAYDAPGPAVLGMSVGAFVALCVGLVAGLPLVFDLLRP